ncbi:hypothetical protein F4775DRAFT_593446 [Biscogniauxia sp. FL1348]|nr:hypothetical protein F4775DRAFT_593446 [Biscogniauxia sp. FL1348]
MALHDSSPNDQVFSSKLSKRSKPPARLRSACDPCHQAKIKCSGESPCLACRASRARCIYSVANQLGRPRGSKNKRNLASGEARNKGVGIQDDRRKNGSYEDTMQSGNHTQRQRRQHYQYQHQHEPDSTPAELDFEHDFNAVVESFIADINQNSLSGPNLGPLINSTSESSLHMTQETDTSNSFPPISNAAVQSLLQSLPNHYAEVSASSSPGSSTFISPLSTDLPERHPVTPDTFLAEDSNHCSCLRQQVQLVYQLGGLQHSHTSGVTVDCILQGVKWAQNPWKSVMQCCKCQLQGNEQEVFLLFSMSVRTLLSLVQQLNISPSGVGTPYETATGQIFGGSSDVPVFVGSFELTGKMKDEVINVAMRSALESITTALLHLWERSGRPLQWPLAGMRISNGNDVLETCNIPYNLSTETHKPPQRTYSVSENMGTQDMRNILSMLQSTTQAMTHEFSSSVERT